VGIDTIEQIDRIVEGMEGRFSLTALLQKRVQEVVRGAPQFLERRTPLRSALAEIAAGKVELSDGSDED
jgi:DNA-directed RNA polymerase subunit K/omega